MRTFYSPMASSMGRSWRFVENVTSEARAAGGIQDVKKRRAIGGETNYLAPGQVSIGGAYTSSR